MTGVDRFAGVILEFSAQTADPDDYRTNSGGPFCEIILRS
jgi:hypothetical protein